MEAYEKKDIFVHWNGLPESLGFTDRKQAGNVALEISYLLRVLTFKKEYDHLDEAIKWLWCYFRDLLRIASGESDIPLAGTCPDIKYPTLRELLTATAQNDTNTEDSKQ